MLTRISVIDGQASQRENRSGREPLESPVSVLEVDTLESKDEKMRKNSAHIENAIRYESNSVFAEVRIKSLAVIRTR